MAKAAPKKISKPEPVAPAKASKAAKRKKAREKLVAELDQGPLF